ncbi:alpha/beta fold hydrolase [Paraburkholderia sp. HP33-1]|uniref:alpha/beta fold hydrolase n=1 Tax=Paraburkholderia sp. HP33-1 TaxID=2883243 RepID=UPI001F481E99|nr:alpha/beta fold hydrolase [Paraburkholderia sp. HP33-1]
MQMAEMKIADLGGIKLHYDDVGEGPALILIHGSGPGASGRANFIRNIEALSKDFRVIVPDLPGFGQSDMKPAGTPIPGWWADKIVELLDHLDIGKAHFVGNSLGGAITLKIAMESPARVDRMILMGPGGGTPVTSVFPTEGIKTLVSFYDGPGPSLERLKAFINQFVYDPSQITEELLAERLKAAMDPRVIAQPPMRPGPGVAFEELWRDPRMARLPHETLIIWGREDRVMPLDTGFVLMKQIPRARLLVMPQCGHWAQWEHAEEFNKTVLGFLKK